jgi:hypothetical protein
MATKSRSGIRMTDLKIYSVMNDEMRNATQEDLDRMEIGIAFLGAERELLRAICRRCDPNIANDAWWKERTKLMRQCAAILSVGGHD